MALVLVGGCGPGGEPTVAADVENPSASRPPVVEHGAAPSSTPSPESPKPTPAVEPEPPPPNAEPAELRLALYGRCGVLGVSTLGGQTFVHYDGGGMNHLERMDERGGVAESFGFTETLDVGYGTLENSTIRGLRGRWPEQPYLLVDFPAREYYYRSLYRLADGSWKRVALLPTSVDYEEVWPWSKGVILALVTDDEHDVWPRFAVVRGEPKGPSLERVRRRGKCDQWDFDVRDVHPHGDGGLTALVRCGGALLATWAPGEREPTVQKLGPNDHRGTLMLGEDGQGFIALDSGIHQWRSGALQPVPSPDGGKLDEVDRGPDGEPWIRQGNVVSRWTAGGWQRAMELPEGPPIHGIYGLDVGTPWLRRGDDSLSMQTADGTWHAVSLSATPDLDKVPKPEVLDVVGPGDVWLTSRYWKMAKGKKHVGREMGALYTTRPVDAPRACGEVPS
ncbi:hypothetical protein [Paraliomyxa miuraensis]|uniref:hypothetical protein n=1 Tax=Paraliomyxa miuraensis TaxID=376150 RepID=UPI0022524779|nr:hypothetical protein [Paraliomyxa miuraensis]MCX4243030.1 hypothetical protein [Paraliomyxa miuraensis]